jgi:hypothetical protein
MTRDDIIKWAQQAGIKLPDGPFPERGSFDLPEVIRLSGLAYAAGTAAEHKRCVERVNIALLGCEISIRDRVIRALEVKS